VAQPDRQAIHRPRHRLRGLLHRLHQVADLPRLIPVRGAAEVAAVARNYYQGRIDVV
jgi:hypothetical protein